MIMLLFLLICTGAATTALNPCQSEDWSYYQGNCYWSSLYHSSVNDHTNNWFGAQIECRKKGADLVSIHSAGENQFIHKLSRCATTWTGLALVNSKHKNSATGWQWIDASARNFIHFYPGYPSAAHASYGNCHAMHSAGNSHDGKWYNSINCGNYRFHYVCKKQATGYTNSTTTHRGHRVRGTCDKGWYMLGSKCYFVNTTRVDFFAAQLQCQSMKSRLVSIHSSKENADLTRIFDECDTPWIGLENTDPNKVNQNIGWRWSDNTLVDYSKWGSSNPANDQQKQCAVLERASVWASVHCWNLLPSVCEKPAPKENIKRSIV